MKKLLILTLSFSLICACSDAWAQDYMRGANGYNKINELRERLAVILEENHRLEVQYSMTKQEFLNMQRQYQARAGDLAGLKKRVQQQKLQRENRINQLTQLKDSMTDTESQVMLKQSQISKLNLELIDINERLRLAKLKLSDMEYAKRQAEMDVKLKKLDTKTSHKDDETRLNQLKSLYSKLVEEEKKVLGQIKEFEMTSGNLDQKVRKLNNENIFLRQQISQLKERKDFKEEENALLRDKKLYHLRLSEAQMWEAEQRKNALKEKVESMQQKIDQLNEKVNTSLTKQSQQKEILKDIIAIDSENKILKNRIYELNEKLKNYQ